MEIRPIYIIGDIHRNFGTLIDIIEKRDLRDCYLICVGDLGIGFQYGSEGELNGIIQMESIFSKRDLIFISIRGNHDDPWYWGIGKNPWTVDYPNFKLIKDYTTLELNGEKFLFVGGAISVDRRIRRPGYSYWVDEVFVLDESKIVECDVLITHSAPNWIGPSGKSPIQGWLDKDAPLWDELVVERAKHDTLYKLAKPKKAYMGHFHEWYAVEFNGCYATILNDQFQIIQHQPYVKEEEIK